MRNFTLTAAAALALAACGDDAERQGEPLADAERSTAPRVEDPLPTPSIAQDEPNRALGARDGESGMMIGSGEQVDIADQLQLLEDRRRASLGMDAAKRPEAMRTATEVAALEAQAMGDTAAEAALSEETPTRPPADESGADAGATSADEEVGETMAPESAEGPPASPDKDVQTNAVAGSSQAGASSSEAIERSSAASGGLAAGEKTTSAADEEMAAATGMNSEASTETEATVEDEVRSAEASASSGDASGTEPEALQAALDSLRAINAELNALGDEAAQSEAATAMRDQLQSAAEALLRAAQETDTSLSIFSRE